MCKNFFKKPAGAGFIQALAVVLYTGLVGVFIRTMDKLNFGEGVFNIIFVLTLLVFSAAVTGLLVFGYAGYLVINKQIRPALNVLGFTFLFLLFLMLLIFLAMAVWQIAL